MVTALMLLLGRNVAEGQIHGQWPGLASEELIGPPGDLTVTTDYRDVLAEIISCYTANGHKVTFLPE